MEKCPNVQEYGAESQMCGQLFSLSVPAYALGNYYSSPSRNEKPEGEPVTYTHRISRGPHQGETYVDVPTREIRAIIMIKNR